jgi:hypothetical protein
MHPAPTLADDYPLPERIPQREYRATENLIEAAVVGLAKCDDAVPVPHRISEAGEQRHEEPIHNDDKCDGHVPEDGAGDMLVHLSSAVGRALSAADDGARLSNRL